MCLCHEQSVGLPVPKRGWIRSCNLIIHTWTGPVDLSHTTLSGWSWCLFSNGGLLGEEYLRTQASLWSIDGPGVARAPHKQAFREQRVADILLPQDRKVGINLFAKPTLATAWVLKASWKDGQDILYRDLKNESQGRTPYFCSKYYWGTVPDLQAQGLTLDPLPSAVYCVPYQAAKESDGAAKYLTHLLGDAKLLAPPKRGPAPRVDGFFQHKAGIDQALQGLVPARASEATLETAIDADSPGNSPVPAGVQSSAAACQPKVASSQQPVHGLRACTPRSNPTKAGRWGAPGHMPAPKARGWVAGPAKILHPRDTSH